MTAVGGDFALDMTGTAGAIGLGIFVGDTVTIDAGDTIGGVTWTGTADATADSAMDITVSELQDNVLDLVAAAGSTALAIALTGGIGDDDFVITGVTTNTSITVTGDLAIGDNSIDIDNTDSTEATSTISIAGLTNYDEANIQLDITSAETVTLGADVDTLVALIGNYGDSVASFTGGATKGDVLDMAAIGTLVGSAVYVEDGALAAGKVVGVTDNAASDWSDILTVMNAAIDTTGDVTGDTIIAISNGTDTRMYFYEDDANAAAIEIDELTDIVVTLTGVDVDADTFVAGNFTV